MEYPDRDNRVKKGKQRQKKKLAVNFDQKIFAKNVGIY